MIYSEGPWTAEQHALNSIEILDRERREIASVMIEEDDEVSEESQGNAQIMTAGLEMYRLLKGVTAVEQTTGSPCPLCGGSFNHKEHCIIPAAEKIIARIETGQS